MTDAEASAERLVPGRILPGDRPIVANAGRRTATVRVHNT